jgi:hypothetical protein
MRRAHLATLSMLAAIGIAVCTGIANADPPKSDDSPAARRQKFLDQGTTDSSSPTPNASGSGPGPAPADVTPMLPPTPEQQWIGSLETLPAGGWQYFTSSTSGPAESAIYVSTHNVTVRGSIVTAWFRWE